MSFNSLQVPLVDNCYNIFMVFQSIQISKYSLVPMVDKYAFLFGSNFIKKSYKEVDSTAINWFSKGFTSSDMQSIHKVIILRSPAICNLHRIFYSPI